MTILTIKIPAAKFDAFKTSVNAAVPNTIGEPVPFTSNENAPATHYVIDLPVTEEIEAALVSELPSGGKRFIRRGPEQEGVERTSGMSDVANKEGLKRLTSDV